MTFRFPSFTNSQIILKIYVMSCIQMHWLYISPFSPFWLFLFFFLNFLKRKLMAVSANAFPVLTMVLQHVSLNEPIKYFQMEHYSMVLQKILPYLILIKTDYSIQAVSCYKAMNITSSHKRLTKMLTFIKQLLYEI